MVGAFRQATQERGSGATGSLTVTGAGSAYASAVTAGQAYSGDINAGRFGTGTISVTNGGAITGNRFYAGNEVGSSGTVLVTGAGSSITATNQFVIGSEGPVRRRSPTMAEVARFV